MPLLPAMPITSTSCFSKKKNLSAQPASQSSAPIPYTVIKFKISSSPPPRPRSLFYQVRVLLKPPYEVTETGWGEFEVQIKIYFHDPNERPVTIYHVLKLFQTDPNVIIGKKPVISEQYDEVRTRLID